MEIHAPEGPAHSLRDFAIHIFIVTLGILIAFSLEGLRESWREHNTVAAAREGFTQELRADEDQLQRELVSVRRARAQIDGIIAEFPRLTNNPRELAARMAAIRPAFYFFTATRWQSAIAGGALSHMEREELNRFTGAYVSLGNYQDVSQRTLPLWLSTRAWFQSHPAPSAAELPAGEEKLRTLLMYTEAMEHVGTEFAADLAKTRRRP